MSDVSAVVLTIGESTTQRAIDSVKRQTLPPVEIILVENVTPSYKAGSAGASKVKTEFLVMVGADMILDEDCIEELRNRMTKNVGIVSGHLRDPLVGRCLGIRLYRKKCFDIEKPPNTISPDTDFIDSLAKHGWPIIYALRFIGESRDLWHTFGEHRPDYTPLYTFSKYTLEGRRNPYWKKVGRTGHLVPRLTKLKNSPHAMALIAQIAMCHGIFLKEETDMLKPFTENEDFNFLESFLRSSGSYKIKKFMPFNLLFSTPKTSFKQYYKLGIDLRKAKASSAFKYYLDLLNKSNDYFALIAKVGLCHGLFSKGYSEEVFENDYAILKELLPQYSLINLLKRFKRLVLPV